MYVFTGVPNVILIQTCSILNVTTTQFHKKKTAITVSSGGNTWIRTKDPPAEKAGCSKPTELNPLNKKG